MAVVYSEVYKLYFAGCTEPVLCNQHYFKVSLKQSVTVLNCSKMSIAASFWLSRVFTSTISIVKVALTVKGSHLGFVLLVVLCLILFLFFFVAKCHVTKITA